jgi:uncharacterized alkaline shock family protein YloU
MSVQGADRVGGDLAQVAADPGSPAASAYAGRIVVHPRVLEKVAQEASASVIGVTRGDVSINVAEGSRGIAVRVTTPLPVPDLDDTAAIQAGEPVLARVGRIQEELRDRIAHLVGRDVARIDMTVTGAVIAQKKRVK